MNTDLIKRFTIEEKGDKRLYDLFMEGIWYPNIDEYRLFLKKIDSRNQEFAKFIEKFQLVKPSDHILETASNLEYSMSDYLKNENKTVIESKFVIVSVSSFLKDSICLSSDTCYISNGVYEDTWSIASNLLGYGSFLIGFCADKDNPVFSETKAKLEKLKTDLNALKKNGKIEVYRDRNKHGNLLILSHRGCRL
ncbi:MAG: hypothetical protein E7168_05695 [Firmicutes bacterium]|nr:hypothetical protein [Bacillota bacterium]